MNQSESSTPGDRFAQILQFQTPRLWPGSAETRPMLPA